MNDRNVPTRRGTTLVDLQDALFKQIDRLSDPNLKEDRLADEVSRTNALCQITGRVIESRKLGLEGWKAARDAGMAPNRQPLAIGTGSIEDVRARLRAVTIDLYSPVENIEVQGVPMNPGPIPPLTPLAR